MVKKRTMTRALPIRGAYQQNPYRNPKDAFGSVKVPLHLVPAVGTAHEAMAFKDGARKYGPYNWRAKEVVASIYVSAAKRHIDAWFDGEELSADAKVKHLGHARACLGIILDAEASGTLIDDRPLPGGAAAAFAALAEKPAKRRKKGRK